MGEPWPDDRIDIVKNLWAEGRSASQIATELLKLTGFVCTRNAVIGIIHRRKLSVRTVPSRPSTRLTPRPPKAFRAPVIKRGLLDRPDNFAAINAQARRERMEREAARNALRDEPIRDMTFARPWIERRSGQCAFPISGSGADAWSCCAPTEEKHTYCRTCEAIIYAPDQPSKKSTAKLANYLARAA